MRNLLEFVIASCLSLLALHTWGVQAFWVYSGSMANAIRGVHRTVSCGECQFSFAVGSSPDDALPTFRPRAICPNCGAANGLDSLPDQPGDRLWVQRVFGKQPLRRWNVAVLRDPRKPQSALVKRVVGLPGESISIVGGNVFVNGELARKSLAQQRGMAVTVYDAGHVAPTAKLPLRWQPTAAASGWCYETGKYRFRTTHSPIAAAKQGDEPFDWLAYRHWQRAPGAAEGVVAAPIEDLCGYNQGVPVVTSHPVDELLLHCEFAGTGDGALGVRIRLAKEELVVRWERNGTARLLHDGNEVAAASAAWNKHGVNRLEVSTVDRQLLCAANGKTIFPAYELDAALKAGTLCELAIGVRNLDVELRKLQLLRDVYYRSVSTNRKSSPMPTAICLKSDEYFVVGDNSLVSYDSRYGAAFGTVDRRLLIGKLLAIDPAGRATRLLAWLRP